ncbi:MAG: DUF2283 domain-containing protein [Thermoleophilia bacterium]
MKINYFQDTDTLYIEFRKPQPATETRGLDENTLIDVDPDGRVSGITIEHASEQPDISRLLLRGLTAA